MNEMYQKLTKEDYENLSKLSYKELTAEIESRQSPYILYGCGYYGCKLVEKDHNYYVVVNVGSTC